MTEFESAIIDVVDFPKEGILFKDIMPVLANPKARNQALEALKKHAQEFKPEAIVGIESRGFFFGMLLAHELDIPFIPIRKKGKLPGKTLSQSYSLEYGEDHIEIQEHSIHGLDRILLHDDVLATGGTCAAALKLLQQGKQREIAVSFLMELDFLAGKDKIKDLTNNIFSLKNY
ncbi:MAG: adenine phosphoribosyltransferase [Flavobacteriales bacterium]|jgi:adenine phosphoribosyltransferase|nr:adenine phosphoribosyltransferase [Flavobacteriales bacterium]